MGLQDQFDPGAHPLGLCGRCCQEYAAGTRTEPPNPAIAILAATIQFGPQTVIVPLPNCGPHMEADAEQAKQQQSAGPRRQFLIAQPGDGLPPGLRG